MATKKFLLEVEEGTTKCKDCPFNEYRCSKLGYIDAEMDCIKYNLATMKILPKDEPDYWEKMKHQ